MSRGVELHGPGDLSRAATVSDEWRALAVQRLVACRVTLLLVSGTMSDQLVLDCANAGPILAMGHCDDRAIDAIALATGAFVVNDILDLG